MIHVEILKNGQTYNITFTEVAKEKLQELYELMRDVAMGKATHHTGDQILDLGDSESFQHLRVWYEAPKVEQLPPNVKVGKPPGMPSWDEEKVKVEYLGQPLQLEYLKHTTADDRVYALPVFINGQPALDMVSSYKLGNMVQQAVGVREKVMVVTPPAPLPDWDEARDYIKDYLKETAKPYEPKDKNAKAWTGHYLDERV